MAAIARLIDFLITFGRNFLTWAYNVAVDLINAAISGFCTFVTVVAELLPNIPLPTGPATPTGPIVEMVLQVLNWLFPVTYLVLCVGFIVSSVIAYWAIAPLARWLKLLT